VRSGVAAFALLGLAACAETPLPPPQATLAGIQAIRAGEIAPMKVGQFSAAPGEPQQMDRAISVRASTQSAPEKSFARYLGDTIKAQLVGAGKFDPGATLVVSGLVTETHVDSLLPDAHAALAAHFTLVRDGRAVFEKTLRADATWKSNIIGAVAIPDAINHYNGLFPELAAKLLADPEFRAAAKR